MALVELFPDADLFSSLVNERFVSTLDLNGRHIRSSMLSRLPFMERYASLLKPLVYIYWRTIILQKYDIVISSSHSFSSKSVQHNKSALHISYIHTPPRYLYEQYNAMLFTRVGVFRWVLSPLFWALRKIDYADAQRPTVLLANSHTVKKRIEKYYGRSSLVIYPPVKLPTLPPKSAPRSPYFLSVSRLVKQKGIELIIRTCNEMQLPLKIVGIGPYEAKLRSLAGPTIEFVGYLDDTELSRVYARSKAVICASIDEDFGLVPIEAMAHGVPVIGYKSGGISESVIDKKTGIFFTEHTVESLKSAITSFEAIPFSPAVCRRQAKKFATGVFKKRFLQVIGPLSRLVVS